MLEIAILFGLSNATIITIADRWKILEFMQINAPTEVFHKLVSCTFCMGFWMAAFETLVIVFISMPPYEYFLIPLASATITKYLT